jgi:putative endonuclease
MVKGGAIYIMTNRTHTTLYVGVTSDLFSRVYQHKTNHYPKSFTAKYNCHKLVYFESFHSIEEDIAREKQIKGGSRKKKLELINSKNSDWKDLFEEIKEW